MKESRSKVEIKVTAAKRLVMWYALNEIYDLVLVTEFPKSGGTWLCSMLSKILDIPFPRNKSPRLEASVMHGHFIYRRAFNKAIGLIRDGRDVMVSAYFHFLFENERNSQRVVEYTRKQLGFADYDDVKANMPDFITYMFTDFSKGIFRFTWDESIESFLNSDSVHVVKYESLLEDAESELLKILIFLERERPKKELIKRVISYYEFNEVKKRESSEYGQSFLRSGVVGDWKNYFNSQSRELFDQFAGNALIAAGYESNDNWAKQTN